MLRRVLVAVLLMVVATTFAFAHGSAEKSASSAQKPKMELLLWWAEHFSPQNALIKKLGEMVGADLKVVTIPYNVYYQKITARIASNNLPVLYKLNIPNPPGFQQLKSLVRAKRIENLIALSDKYHATYWKKYLESDRFPYLRTKDNGIYISPDWEGPSINGLYVREDWMKKLHLKAPTSWDPGMVKFLEAIKQANPDGKVVAPLSGGSAIPYVISAYTHGMDTAQPFRQYQGKWIFLSSDPGYLQAIKYLHELYTKGLLHPTAVTGTTTSPDEYERLMSDGEVGVLGFVTLPGHWTHINDVLLQNFPKAELGILPPPAGPDGHVYVAGGPGYFGGDVINSDKPANIQKKAVQIMNFLYSPAGETFLYNGVKGIDYTVKGGKMVPIPAARKRDFAGNVSDLIDFTDREYEWTPAHEPVKWLRANAAANAKYDVRQRVIGLSSNSYIENYNNVTQVLTQYRTQFITGQLPITTANWNKMLKAEDAAGLQQMMQEVKAFKQNQG